MKPSIGRIVHYVNLGDKNGKYPPEVQAALITGIYTDDPHGSGGVDPANGTSRPPEEDISMSVDLLVFYRTGYFQCKAMPFSPTYERGHWSWPPKV